MEISAQNESAWNQNNYDALINRYGSPADAASKIMKNPAARLRPLNGLFGDIKGKRVVNLMGSHGSKAVALSLLGAQATVIDFSEENASYARDLAEKANTSIRYIVSDVLNLTDDSLWESFDYVLMELGILHYFMDLAPLFDVIKKLLSPGGRLVLHDFHPISTKLITSKGKKHKVDGNYFNPSLSAANVAYSKHLSTEATDEHEVLLRKWTLGEIITAIAEENLVIKKLSEEPNIKVHDIGIPKTFTVVAEKGA
nr:class I SAM-dependent methyltransferase [Pseudalkalibacillus caeni]